MNKRIGIIDALRGFSLLGILIANMLYFQYGNVTLEAIQPETWWDKLAYYFTKIFVEGSFIPIFGFIFGYSIILFVRSIEKREFNIKGPLWRRAIGLIILGILHTCFVWDGDILIIYGSGLLLFMLFIKREVKTMLIWAAILTIITAPFLFITTDVQNILLSDSNAIIEILKNGTYLEVVKSRVDISNGMDASILFVVIGALLAFFLIVVISFLAMGPFVLLGMSAAKVDFFQNIEEKFKLLKRVSFLIPVGIVCKAFLNSDFWIAIVLHGFGAYILAIGYIAMLTLLFIKIQQSTVFQAFMNLGRLSLTNYLMQSIICTTIFYGYGFGLFGKLGVALGLLIATIIYLLQLVISNWYMQRFSSGPVEWAFRKFVYLRDGRQ